MWIFDKLFNRKIEGKSSLDDLAENVVVNKETNTTEIGGNLNVNGTITQNGQPLGGGTKLYKHIITLDTGNKLTIHSIRETPYTAFVGTGSVGDDLGKGNCYFVSGIYNEGQSILISGLISNGGGFYIDKYNWEHNARLDPVFASNTMFVADNVSGL